MLDDFVGGAAGTAAADEDVAVALGGEGVFADLGPPDVWKVLEGKSDGGKGRLTLDGAATGAVDTLSLVLADDGVLQGGAVGEDEDGGVLTSFGLAGAVDVAAAVGLEASVEGAGDLLRGVVVNNTSGGWDVEVEGTTEDPASRRGGGRGGEKGESLETHGVWFERVDLGIDW